MSGRAGVLTGWLVLLALAGALVARTPFVADMSVFLPARPTPEQQMLVDNLSSGVVSRLLLVGIDRVPPAQQAAFSSTLAARLRADPRYTSIDNGQDDGQADQQLLFTRRYQMSAAVTPEHFGSDALRQSLQQAIADLSSSTGLITKQLLARDPTGELMALLAQLAGGSEGSGPRQQDGVWVSRDGQRLTLLAHTRANGADLDAQQQAIDGITQAVAAVRQDLGLPQAQLKLSGPGVFAVSSREAIRGDVTRLSTLGTGLILLLLVLVFRSLPALWLTLVPMASAVLAGAASVSLMFGSLHGLTLGFGTTLIGEAVDYALYHLIRAGSLTPVPASAFWSTIRLGVATSVIGFAALLFSGFPGLAQMAVFSICGLVTAALVTRFVLPALTPAGFRSRDFGTLDLRLAGWIRQLRPARWPVALVTVAALAWVVSQRDRLWDTDIASLNPVSAAAQSLDSELRESSGTPAAAGFIVVSADTLDQALAAAEATAARLDPLVAGQRLAGYDSPTRWLPSLATQAARRAALPDATTLQQRLQQATEGLPIRAARLAPFVDDVQAARALAPLTRDDFAGTRLGLKIDAQLTRYRDRPAVLMPVFARGEHLDADAVMAALGPAPAGTERRLLQPKRETDALYDGYLHEAGLLSLGGTIAIVLLLACTIRPLRALPQVCAPLAGAVVLVMAGYLAAGHPMNLLHLIGLLLVVAVGSNYALFFHSLRAGSLAQGPSGGTLAALLFANLTGVTGFGVLAFSSVPLLAALGQTVGAGAVLALLLSCLWIGVTPDAAR